VVKPIGPRPAEKAPPEGAPGPAEKASAGEEPAEGGPAAEAAAVGTARPEEMPAKRVARPAMRVLRRVVALAVTAGIALVVTWTGLDEVLSDRDMQRHGARAQVPVIATRHEPRQAFEATVRMPDGTVATIVEPPGPVRTGGTIEVVYWTDDQADPESPGWPNADTYVVGLMAGAVDLVALAVLYGLVVPPIRRRHRTEGGGIWFRRARRR
jgi:hypothetical protein